MKCPFCNGTGIVLRTPTGDIKCFACKGAGKASESMIAKIRKDMKKRLLGIKKL